ncbi:hypothetical protein [Symbiopectobacterium purcellii]|uniref:hypothetical protein n=1 Tax=Symbiopectobacterium purcellii TaxID=2871826 RepID=UPI003F87239F
MINKERLLRDNRLCKAIIGLSVEELKNLAAEFSACYLIYRKKNRKDHERQMGAGQKGFIPTPLDKLLFILLYLKWALLNKSNFQGIAGSKHYHRSR